MPAPMPRAKRPTRSRCSPRRRRRPLCSAGASGRRVSAARNRRRQAATGSTIPPAASTAPRSRRLSVLPGLRSRALRWPRRHNFLRWPTAAAAIPIVPGRRLICATPKGRPYITAAAGLLAGQDITTNRTVTAAGVDQLRAEFDANAWSAARRRLPVRGTLDRRCRHLALCRGPVHHLRPAGYAERVLSGAATFALAYGAGM